MEEIWKSIEGYDRYSVSNKGRVMNTSTGIVLKQFKTPKGYTRISIMSSDGKKSKSISIHRLVAHAFIENPENKETVDHIDRDPYNNNADNLRWYTRKEQASNRKKKTGASGERAIWKCHKITGEKLKLFIGATAAMRSLFGPETQKSASLISMVSNGKRQSAYGFKWEYHELKELDGEDWKTINSKDVNGVHGYQISNMGRIKHPRGFIRVPYINDTGYMIHSIGGKSYLAHRLVAQYFLEHVPGKLIVNHKDMDRTNPMVDNIEYVTSKENAQHAMDSGLTSHTIAIYQYTLDGEFIKEYVSCMSASRQLGISSDGIKKSINTPGWTHGGFQWVQKGETRKIGKVDDSRLHQSVRQYTLAGEFVHEFKNAQEAADSVKRKRGAVWSAKKTMGICAGFQWRGFDETRTSIGEYIKSPNNGNSKPVQQIQNGVVFKEYISLVYASKETGYPKHKIYHSITSGESYNGYEWVRVDPKESKKRKREE